MYVDSTLASPIWRHYPVLRLACRLLKTPAPRLKGQQWWMLILLEVVVHQSYSFVDSRGRGIRSTVSDLSSVDLGDGLDVEDWPKVSAQEIVPRLEVQISVPVMLGVGWV